MKKKLNFTDQALNQINLITKGDKKKYFRITVQGGGCSGFKYSFGFDYKSNGDDIIFGKTIIKILNKITKKESLFDTVLVSINDELVSLFLENKIKFLDISTKIWHLINSPLFSKFKRQKPKNLAQIEKLNEFVRLKTRTLSVISKKK